MLKRLERNVRREIKKAFGIGQRRRAEKPPPQAALPAPPPQPTEIIPPPPPPPPPSPPPPVRSSTEPFLFPRVKSKVLPDPSTYFAPHLLSTPLPTNSFFQNFVLNHGDQPEYIHPYLIKSYMSSLALCYPPQCHNSTLIYQIFSPDLTISAWQSANPKSPHLVSSFSDLGVTLEHPSSNLTFFLMRGSPFLTCNATGNVAVTLSTIHAIVELSSNTSLTKHTIKLSNNQTWLLYASSPINLTQDNSTISSSTFTGILRLAVLPNSDPNCELILDRFRYCYPLSGDAVFTRPFCLEYRWKKRGWGDLLMLAHPLHLRLLSRADCSVTVLEDFKYNSIDGELVGIVGDTWVLRSDPISINWHSIRGIKEEHCTETVNSLIKDVEALNSSTISTTSSYFYGKLIARAARLALIAEEVSHFQVIPAIRKFLKDTIEPWLDGTFEANGFVHDAKWGGILTKQGSLDAGADSGFGIYNDHHYHLGYFIYAIAVLAKLDPYWGRKYRRQAYSIMADFMNSSRRPDADYPRLRHFDLWKLHSWAGGLTEFADGRNQESTSEAVNAYYSAALMGLAYGDTHLAAIGSTLSSLEIQSAQTWWHVREDSSPYAEEFRKENRVVGVLWANKRDSGLWFAPPEWRERRVVSQVLPLLPITEVVFSDVQFVKEIVAWAMPALSREGVGEGSKGFVYALEVMYDREGSLDKIRKLNGFDDGNSLTNLLWWIHSRGAGEERAEKLDWFRHYSH